MRTKTLVLSAAFCLAAVASFAQTTTNVYSVNAVGYVNVSVAPDAYQIVSNPLNTTNNTLQTILPDAPVNTIVYKYDPVSSTFTAYTKRSTGLWSGVNVGTTVFNPGEGFFIKNPDTANSTTYTFVGEVPQGTNLTVTLNPGYSLVAAQVPVSGRAEADLGIPAQTGDVIYKYVNGAYQTSTKRSTGAWTGIVPGDPVIAVAEGFFYYTTATASRDWVRSFSVNS